MDFPIPLSAPYLSKAQSLGLNPFDVDESFIRGGGKGGQKINKTASTVQLIHRPTGIEVRMQRHREQSKNRLSAWKLLIEKLEERVKGKESKRAQAIFKLKKQKKRRSRKAQQKVLEQKKDRGLLKELRKPIVN